MKKLISLFTVLTILAASFPAAFPAASQDYPDIALSYPDIFSAVTDGIPTVIASKETEGDEKHMRFVPDTSSSLYTDTQVSKKISLDSWGLAKYKIDLNAYKYITVEYRYTSSAPQSDYPVLHLLPQKVLKKRVSLTADQPIAQGKRSVMTFFTGDLTEMLQNPAEPYLVQIHFFPFGDVNVNALDEKDELFIYSVTFSANDPLPDRSFTVSIDGKNTLVKPGEAFTLPPALPKEGQRFKGYIPASNAGQLMAEGTSFNVTSSLYFTSYYIPDEKLYAEDIVFGNFKDYYSAIVDGRDTGYAEKTEELLFARANPATTSGDLQLKLDGWDYGGMRISASEHRYAYVLMKVENAEGIIPVMNIMKSDVFTGQISITSSTTLIPGKWCFAEFDVSGMSGKLIDESVSGFVKQIHFLPFGKLAARKVPENAAVYIDKIIFSKERLDLTLHDRLISGYGDGTFRPSGTITRAEAAAMTARLLGIDGTAASESSIPDVPADSWHSEYVKALADSGIINTDTPFRPDEPATRAELADMLYRTGIKTADIHKSFPDLYQSHPYYESVRKAAGAGIIDGYSDGTFRPDGLVTRAEAVKMFSNLTGRYAHIAALENAGVFTDVDSKHWCRQEITELAVRHIMNGGTELTTDASGTVLSFNGGVSAELIEKGNAKKAETDALFEERKRAILDSPTTVTVTGAKYYVSNSGDDSNDGLSPETPFRTAARVNSMKLAPGDGVFFRRGDLWRETLICAGGVTYSAYGEGEKPKFYGSPENGSGAEKWTLLEGTDNIWKFHSKMRDVGGIVLNGGEQVFEKKAPHFKNGVFYVDAGTEPFDVKKHLAENLTFFSDIPFTDLKAVNAYGYVYLRCDSGNPGELFGDLEFITTGYAVYFPKADTVIDNLCALYAQGGINGSTNVINATVQNCEVGYIGGNLQGYDVFGGTTGRPTRYGNGINFYGACNGYYVYNNYIHDVYDAGISNQYAKGGTNEIRNDNIQYSGNVIERCCYGIEYFMGVADTYAVRIMTNMDISGNIIRDTGSGFGRADPSACAAIKGWDHNNHAEGFTIRNNIFCGSYAHIYHIGASYAEWLPKLSGNVYIQRAGAPFGRYGKNPSTLYTYDFGIEERASRAMNEPDGEYWFFSDGG